MLETKNEYSIIRRAEWSLFTQGHVIMISFFPFRDIPLRFNSLNLIFSAVISNFCKNTTTGSRSIVFQTFGGGNFFRRVISDKNFNFRIVQRAKGRFLSSVFTVSLEMLIFLHQSMDHFSAERPAVVVFAKKNVRQFFIEKAEIFEFLKQIQHSPLFSAFLKFDLHSLQTFCGIQLLNP